MAGRSSEANGDEGNSRGGAEQAMKPVFFEIFGEMWKVQARLGQGVSASVYRVSSGRASLAAVKEFQVDAQGGDYGYHKERSVLEDIQGRKNIVTLYGVFTNHNSAGVATRCLLLELLDVSVSELLVRASNQGHSMWLIQHCARDVLEALAFLHRAGYVHADLKPRNVLWSADDECFKLIDFGLSYKEGHQDVKYIQTDGYRAPEAELQNSLARAGMEGDRGCTTAIDLWSLGIILLEMYSGIKLKETVRSQEWKDKSSAIIDHIFASKIVVGPAIPVYHLRDLIKSLLHNDPAQRSTAKAALCSAFFSIPFVEVDPGTCNWILDFLTQRQRTVRVCRHRFSIISVNAGLRPLLSTLLTHDCTARFSNNHIIKSPHIEDLVMLPTPVLRLLNVIDDGHLHNEEEYEDIVEDMKTECRKYGAMVSLLIPKENPGKGQVFVEYANAGDSKEAQRLLTGRTFDGKFVVATFYPLSAYKRGYLYQTVQ